MDLYHELQSLIAQVRTRWRRRIALKTTARMLLGSAVVLAAGALAEYALRPQGTALLALAGGTIAVALAAAALLVSRLPPRPSDRQVARFIEERAAQSGAGQLHDSLVSAIAAAERTAEDRAGFLPLILRDALARVRLVPVEQIVPAGELRSAALGATAAAAVLLTTLIVSAPFLDRAGATARVRLFPRSVRVDVRPGDMRVAAGTALRIEASLHGPHGYLTGVVPELSLSLGGSQRSVAMVPNHDGFAFTVGAVDRSFSYVVNAGPLQSSRFTVTALTPPRVERIDLHYDTRCFPVCLHVTNTTAAISTRQPARGSGSVSTPTSRLPAAS